MKEPKYAMKPPDYDSNDEKLKNTKANYQVSKVNELQSFNYFLFITYYVVASLACLVIIFLFPYNIYLKILIIIFLLAYPFFIYELEMHVYNSFNYSLSFLYGNAYESEKK